MSVEGSVSLPEVWQNVISAQPAPPALVVLITGAVALLAVLGRAPWRIARNAITIAHEGGHGLLALLTGRRLDGIRLHSDTSGLTLSAGRPTGPGMVLTSAAGYLTPALLGLGSAAVLASGRISALLWIYVLLLAVLLVMVRNVYGWALMITVGAVFFIVPWFASSQVQSAFAYLVTWFLLLAAPKPVFELHRQRRRGRARDSDADQLARITPIGGGAWVGLFTLITLGALLVGGSWLLGSTPVLSDINALAGTWPAR